MAAPLEAELSQNEVETFAGLWWENEPAFNLVIAFTRDGAKTLQPYLSNKDLRDSPFLEIRMEYCLQSDVNADGYISVLDTTTIGANWGSVGNPGWIPSDVNRDGMISVLDLVMVGSCW